MKALRSIRCVSCKRRIRAHHPGSGVTEASTGKLRFYRAWCAGDAFESPRGRGGVHLAVHRYVEESAN